MIELYSDDPNQQKIIIEKLRSQWGDGVESKRGELKKMFAVYAYGVISEKSRGDMIKNKNDAYSAACGAIVDPSDLKPKTGLLRPDSSRELEAS